MARAESILVSFGKRVRELRKAKGWSQERFADICGLDRSYISLVELGKRNLTLETIGVIARHLGISVSELTRGIDNP